MRRSSETCTKIPTKKEFSQLKVERESARQRQDVAGTQVNQLLKVFNCRRKELDDFRRATFESYAAQHPPPPSYDAITSPTPSPSLPPFPTPDVGPSIDSIHKDKPLPPAPLTQSPQLEPFVPISVPSPTTTLPRFRPVHWGSSKSSRKRKAI